MRVDPRKTILTDKPHSKFKWWQKALLVLALLAGLGLLTVWFATTATFWQQVGWRLVAELQKRVNGEVSVGKISGNLITGMVFDDVRIKRFESDLIRVKQLEVSLSLLSFLRLQPVIRTLAFRQPQVFLRQDVDGSWNVANLLKKMPPPPFSQIHLSNIRIDHGRVEVSQPQQHQTFQDIEARLNLTFQAPGRPQSSVPLHYGTIGFTVPPYPRLQADLALAFSNQEITIKKTALSLADIPVLTLQGKLTDPATAPNVALNFTIPELSGPQLHQLWPGWPQTLPIQGSFAIRGPLENMQVTGTAALQECQAKITGSWQKPAAAPAGFDLLVDFRNLGGKVLSAWWRPRPGIADALTPLSGTLSLSGGGRPWPVNNLQARLELRPFSYRQAKVEAAALTLKLVPGTTARSCLKSTR